MKKLIVAALAALALGGCATVETGNRGVVTYYSKPTGEVKSEGFTWVTWGYDVVQLPVGTQAHVVKAAAASKDLQHVDTEITVNYNLDSDPKQLVSLYERLQKSYEDKVINPTVQDSLKAATANFPATDLIAKREVVRLQIEKDLRARLKPYGIHVSQVLITNFSFTTDFEKAVEAKVAAQQTQQTASIEAKTKQIRAEGEAAAQRAMKQSLNVTNLRKMELDNQAAAIAKWDGQLPTVTGGSIPMINLPAATSKTTPAPEATAEASPEAQK